MVRDEASDGKQATMKTNLLGCGVANGGHETRNLIAHRLGCDTGGGSLEVDMRRSTDAEGVAAGHQ